MSEIPIVALHGNVGTADDWARLGIPNLEALDLWSFSDLSLDEFSMFLAEELVDKDERPLIAGYSLGGRLALESMARFPERWSGAVILSANPGLSDAAGRKTRFSADEEWAQKVRTVQWSDFLKEWNAQPILAGCPISEGQTALESRREAVAMGFDYWSLGHQGDLREALKSFKAPVLWISGENDSKYRAFGEEMADVFEDYRHVVLADHGHRCLSPAAAAAIADWRADQ